MHEPYLDGAAPTADDILLRLDRFFDEHEALVQGLYADLLPKFGPALSEVFQHFAEGPEYTDSVPEQGALSVEIIFRDGATVQARAIDGDLWDEHVRVLEDFFSDVSYRLVYQGLHYMMRESSTGSARPVLTDIPYMDDGETVEVVFEINWRREGQTFHFTVTGGE